MTKFVLQGVRINDPHVAAVIYAIEVDKYVEYLNPPPLAVVHDVGQVNITDRKLRIEPRKHFPTEAEAVEALGPFLQGWEAYAALKTGRLGTLRFQFEKSEIIDRNPLPPDPNNPEPVGLVMRGRLLLRGEVHAVQLPLTLSEYPPPPASFQWSPEFDNAFARWRHFQSGAESLQTTAYYVLTLLERTSSGKNQRRAAAIKYAIDFEVLRKIGDLVSERGSPISARKFVNVDLTAAEQQWLIKATLTMVLRLGESAAGGQLPIVTMSSLPPLP